MSINRRSFLQDAAAGSAAAATLVASGCHVAQGAESEKIKFGQIGTKHAHASGKIGTARKFPDLYEVVGVVEPDDERWNAVANSGPYKGVKRMTQEELLNVKGLQTVAVETEVRGLLDVAEKCIKAGVHIHLDKPAGESLPHFKRILDEATRQGLTVQMGYMYRYNPAFQLAFRAQREGWLGHVFEVHTTMSKKIGAGSRKQLAEYAGGSMFELGCHIIDAVVSVLGKPDKVTPFNRVTFPKRDSLLDNCLAVFEYPDATATVRTALIEFDGGARRQFVVCGDQGVIDIKPLEPPKAVLALQSDHGDYRSGRHEVPLKPLGGRYDGDLIDLARIIRGEKSSDFPPEHDLAVQEAVLAASGLPIT